MWTTSLAASITYSYAHLTDQTRRLLPAVSLFHGIADQAVLAVFSALEGVPGRFAEISQGEWSAVLADAARVGLFTGLGAGLYRIHPALPSYLAAGWRAEDPSGYDQERQACEQSLCAACAAFSQWLSGQIASGDAAFAYTLIGLQRPTLGAMLGHALDHREWADAERIVRALDDYWDTRGLGAEADAWADRILNATPGPDQVSPKPVGKLWLYTTIRQANRQLENRHSDQASQTYRRALSYLKDQPASDWTRASIAVTFHQLGMAAQARGRLDEAEDWYRKSLTVKEELGDLLGAARTYGQLGLLAEAQQQPRQALDWIVRCLASFAEFPHPVTGPGPLHLARITRQLGLTALEEAWREVTGHPLPQPVRDYISSQPDEQPAGES